MTKKTQKETNQTVTEEITAVLEEIVEEPAKKKGESVTVIDETNFLIGERHYRLAFNHRDGFDLEKIGERYSEVLSRYDYIVGDWGYEQLRLKGFFQKDNRKVPADQRIDALEDYLYEYCNFGCAYFVIERIGGKKEKRQGRRRRRKNPNSNNQTQAAHIDEKKAPVNKQKNKPVIKNRKQTDIKTKPAKEKSTTAPKANAGFTIRKRED